MLLGVMLMALNEEMERAASRRVEENREMRRIFADASGTVTDAGLSERLAHAAKGNETSFAISDLERANAELRALLIELHAHVEELDAPDARSVEAEIWRELVASTERRRLMMSPF
jgi:FKBP-type peptidyl-prolyl cis-trans isomerase (trigger factor)